MKPDSSFTRGCPEERNPLRARSSTVEHPVYIGQVAGSNPAAPNHLNAGSLEYPHSSGSAFSISSHPLRTRNRAHARHPLGIRLGTCGTPLVGMGLAGAISSLCGGGRVRRGLRLRQERRSETVGRKRAAHSTPIIRVEIPARCIQSSDRSVLARGWPVLNLPEVREACAVNGALRSGSGFTYRTGEISSTEVPHG
jgi:hypothetical protein